MAIGKSTSAGASISGSRQDIRAYVAGVKAAVDSHGYPFLDMRAYMPSASSDPLGIYPDGVHPSLEAHAWYGDIVAEWTMSQSTIPVEYSV